MIRSGIYKIPSSTDPVEQMKVKAFQALSEEIVGDMLKQQLVGISPFDVQGIKLEVEIAYWMVGFSATCTFTSATIPDSPMLKQLMEISLNVLMRQPVNIQQPLHKLLRDSLEDILENKRMLLIQSGMKSWENPMVNQYASSNLGRFDKDTLISTMESILGFMKANDGFMTK